VIIEFKVQGKPARTYTAAFTREGEALIATCTCAAGQHHQYCKHRFGLLSGDATDLVSGNASQINQLPAMLAGSNVEAATRAIAQAEAAQQIAAKQVTSCKRMLARVMSG
jgi:uncharacterized Zn finger protein